MKSPQQKTLIAAVAGLLTTQLVHAADVTWTASTYGNWSDGTKWSTNAAPASDGSDKILFAPATGAVFNTGVNASSWAVSGIELSGTNMATAGSVIVTIAAGPLSSGLIQANQTSTLSLGTGGIVLSSTAVFATADSQTLNLGSSSVTTNKLTLNTTGDQIWQVASNRTGSIQAGSGSTLNINANLTGSGIITIQGVTDANTSNRAAGVVKFLSGTTSDFTGSFVLKSGGLWLGGTSQLDRLGSGTLTMYQNTSGHNNNNTTLTLDSMNAATQEFKNEIAFVDQGGSRDGINFVVNSTAAAGSKLTYSGNWSGSLQHSLIFSSNNGENLLLSIKGNNSGLTTTKTAVAGDSSGRQISAAVYVKGGALLLENANALGTGNAFSVSLSNGAGGSASTTAVGCSASSLYTTNTINVGSLIYADSTSSTNLATVAHLGLKGTGSAEFTGAITMRGVAGTDKAASTILTAQTGGTSVFSGKLIDQDVASNIANSTVTVAGGGTVVLSNAANTYKGSTSVFQGTTLLANGGGSAGSATGTGSVRVGADAVSSFTATTTANRAYITVSSVAGLYVGQTITGTGIPAGTTITYVNSSNNTIEISQNATATGAVTASVATETGILGGVGRITPGTGAAITVANGSVLAPGTLNTIGSLTLDSKSTASALLTMASGASFTFNLGTANTSDQLIFWNYAAGDFLLNNNVINLTDVQAGTYTLMSFYSNSGSTGVDNSVVNGFLTGLSLGGVDAQNYEASLGTSGNSIILTVAAVPEPSTWAMIVGGMGLLALRMRRRMA